MHDTTKILIAKTRAYAVEHRARSWWHFSSTLLLLCGLVAIAAAASWWPTRLAASLLAGLMLVRMFIIYHDVLHGSMLGGSRVAAALMSAYGLLILNPRSIWSRSHNHHHRTVGQTYGSSIGSYPIMSRAGWRDASLVRRLQYVVQRHPLTMALGYVTVFLYGMCLRAFVVDTRRHWDAGLAVLVHGGLITMLAVFAPHAMLNAVLVPMTVACALGAYLFYAQHNYPDARIMGRGDWSYAAAALTSSSYMQMGALMRWFTGNIGFHHVHHLNPRIPFYRLPEAMRGMVELQHPGRTSLSLRQIWKCLRLRLWDPERERLVRR
ncbi:MAG TPA: fatty acid desaturase [Xanthomonadales bacterium]|nr:fatty acid desaturase [Xanthomonadales bacterium]